MMTSVIHEKPELGQAEKVRRQEIVLKYVRKHPGMEGIEIKKELGDANSYDGVMLDLYDMKKAYPIHYKIGAGSFNDKNERTGWYATTTSQKKVLEGIAAKIAADLHSFGEEVTA